MAIFRKSDEALIITAASNLETGAVVTIGSLVGVCHAPIASGAQGAVAIKGIYEFACDASIEQGADVYVTSEGHAAASASGLTKAGIAATAGTSGGVIEVVINA